MADLSSVTVSVICPHIPKLMFRSPMPTTILWKLCYATGNWRSVKPGPHLCRAGRAVEFTQGASGISPRALRGIAEHDHTHHPPHRRQRDTHVGRPGIDMIGKLPQPYG